MEVKSPALPESKKTQMQHNYLWWQFVITNPSMCSLRTVFHFYFLEQISLFHFSQICQFYLFEASYLNLGGEIQKTAPREHIV